MDESTSPSPQGSTAQAEEKTGSPTTLERSTSRGEHHGLHGDNSPEQPESSDSKAPLSPREDISVGRVRQVVDSFEAAISAVLLRKPRWKSSENVNPDENNQNLSTKLQQNVDQAEGSSRNFEDVAGPSDASVDVTGPSTSVPRPKAIDKRALGRVQSAKESSRPKDGRPPRSLSVQDDNTYGMSKSVSSRTNSARTGTLSSWFADIKSKVQTIEIRLERALSSPVSRSSSIPLPTLTYPNTGLELPRNISKKSGGSIEAGQALGEQGGIDDNEQSPIEEVALIVPTTDDPNIPYWTFRTVVLGTLSCTLITFLNTYFSYRNEPIIITVTTVLIATGPIGRFMASSLPNRVFRIPGTQRRFSLNPGPFSIKEHGLITIFASAGSSRPGGISVVNVIKVFLHGHIGFLTGFLVTATCELFGYSWAILLYKFLVEPARFWWPGSLVNVSLVKALNLDEKRKGISLIGFFLICFAATSAYYVIPGFFIPSVTSVSVICYIFKDNVLAQQLGSGKNGLGLASFSMDWATISGFLGSPLVVPWAAVVNILVGFVIQAYLVAPITYYKNWFNSKNFPIFSNDIFTKSGQVYDVSKVLDRTHSGLRRSNAGLAEDGLPHFSAFYTMSMGMTFALFGSVFSQVIFFNGKDLLRTFLAVVTQRPAEAPDIHTRLMNKYPQIPARWGILLFLGTHLVAIVNLVAYKDQLQMEWWGVLLASALASVLIVPVCIIVATSNQVPNLGIIPQYLMGFICAGEPVTNAMFRTYSAVICGRAGTYLGNFKLGLYIKIPPRATFRAQLTGILVASFVSTLVATWLTGSIDNICDLTKLPRNTPWTCPHDKVFYDQAVTFGVAGTHQLFTKSDAPYRTLNYYFIPGFCLPVVLWLLGRGLPGYKWILILNGPLIVRGASFMPPSPVVNNVMWVMLALFFSLYVFNYRKRWWQRYNYVVSAALDAGTVSMALLLYYSLDEGKKVLNWWGEKAHGDHCPLASCPTAPGHQAPGCPVN